MQRTDPQPCLQALDAGSSAALPEGLRHDLEELEAHGGVAHLQDLGAQIKVGVQPAWLGRQAPAHCPHQLDLLLRAD